jgi:hypothetical protein
MVDLNLPQFSGGKRRDRYTESRSGRLWQQIEETTQISEEPGLEARFGESYRVYKQQVPRWLPGSSQAASHE